MPKIKYQDIRFSDVQRSIVDSAIDILAEYEQGGYVPTLRSLYYQFVARDLFPEQWADAATGSKNNEKSYDKLGIIIANARLAGLIDWESLEDMTRELEKNSHWEGPQDIIRSCADQFRLDLWETQSNRVEIWIEKDALKGIIAPSCRQLDVPYFSCRGYTSMTAMWNAAQRLIGYTKAGQTPIVLHFGDHDPSGIDMSRDIADRLKMFRVPNLVFERIALNMDRCADTTRRRTLRKLRIPGPRGISKNTGFHRGNWTRSRRTLCRR